MSNMKAKKETIKKLSKNKAKNNKNQLKKT